MRSFTAFTPSLRRLLSSASISPLEPSSSLAPIYSRSASALDTLRATGAIAGPLTLAEKVVYGHLHAPHTQST
eukprot:CAMPEP_0198362022 /NCGR_PEP_ID=MMETSP1450-20131203/144445_1 /TAXON_ID=753684 ORGANISM="Madagascaria erythrocladiodes, Strain CCMP3234" /NCGR_SAMPLE_ID=MMETSP1450 /ASSEMBLY_ACC=CAM_ASM_001115 /LENGTH=72 /DNA_ID=CAMNT_0044069185 /DNA_START=60 /DNA_END=274 /DNA_ORIENTATION=+